MIFRSCPFPNGTDKAIYSYMCADSKALETRFSIENFILDEQFTITDIQVTDKNNNPIYPVDPRQEFILNLTTYNHGQQVFETPNKLFFWE